MKDPALVAELYPEIELGVKRCCDECYSGPYRFILPASEYPGGSS